jgi:hypothetical protein
MSIMPDPRHVHKSDRRSGPHRERFPKGLCASLIDSRITKWGRLFGEGLFGESEIFPQLTAISSSAKANCLFIFAREAINMISLAATL